ncbi:MAG: hypothetical protein HY843_01365 [Bdellovibrio sp.]|nr:hypothetical protein [Bdellovibrio sp.]
MRRLETITTGDPKTKSSQLPHDYLKMVKELYTTHFDSGLKTLAKLKTESWFEVTGEIFTNEIVLCISLHHKGQLSATSVYASSDFDPTASAPNIQDILGACVDAIGAVYEPWLSSDDTPDDTPDDTGDKLCFLTDIALAADAKGIPSQWTRVEIDKKNIYVKLDKSNPVLDKITENWLVNNDPELKEKNKQEEQKSEDLFITGKKKS